MLIGLMGRQGAGKDFTARILIEEYGTRVERFAFADPMRKALHDLNPTFRDVEDGMTYSLKERVDALGWDWVKNEYPEVRALLQRFGTEMGRNNFGADFWVNLAWKQIQPLLDNGISVVITDVRFANEIARVHEAGGQLWRITRTDLEPEDLSLPRYQHASEKDWREADVDLELTNGGPSHAYMYRYEVLQHFEIALMRQELTSLDGRRRNRNEAA